MESCKLKKYFSQEEANFRLSKLRKLEIQKNDDQQTDFYLKLLKNNISSLPQQFDWRNLGKISQVKNQGNCGSCWAFTTTGLFEHINLIRNNSVELYSEQDLLDCSSNGIYKNIGCQGGWPYLAFKYSQQNRISSSLQYSYTGVQGNCTVNQKTKKAFYPAQPIQIYMDEESNKTQIIKKLLINSPLAVIVDASNWSNYKSGVFSNCTTQQNHVALLVGYTSEGDQIVKNSWGSTWGEFGKNFQKYKPKQDCLKINKKKMWRLSTQDISNKMTLEIRCDIQRLYKEGRKAKYTDEHKKAIYDECKNLNGIDAPVKRRFFLQILKQMENKRQIPKTINHVKYPEYQKYLDYQRVKMQETQVLNYQQFSDYDYSSIQNNPQQQLNDDMKSFSSVYKQRFFDFFQEDDLSSNQSLKKLLIQ
ncbi:hypothetical protein ABPG72_012316 [Tetrahymena utriculariae]